MYRLQRTKRAAAAAAETKIKTDLATISMTEGKAKRRPSSKSRAPQKGSKSTNQKSKREYEEKSKPAPSTGPAFFPASQEELSGELSEEEPPSDAEDEAMEAHKEHMQRRALREVHSNQSMRLSRRSSFRISRDRAGTPVYSPICATKLRLTPDADESCFQDDSSL
ncbi:MAG: hypothetical protein SGBAC_008166 [Bacillariaceae sp.]